MAIKGTEKLAGKDNDAELGTEASGFASGGPFSCMDCLHRTPHSFDSSGNLVDSCSHPLVIGDDELTDKKLPDGTVEVDADDCCRYVRPKEQDND